MGTARFYNVSDRVEAALLTTKRPDLPPCGQEDHGNPGSIAKGRDSRSQESRSDPTWTQVNSQSGYLDNTTGRLLSASDHESDACEKVAAGFPSEEPSAAISDLSHYVLKAPLINLESIDRFWTITLAGHSNVVFESAEENRTKLEDTGPNINKRLYMPLPD